MIKAEIEQIQYLLTQYLEGVATSDDLILLFSIMDREPDDTIWADILEELIASEAEMSSYDPAEWNGRLQKILLTGSKQQKIHVDKNSTDANPAYEGPVIHLQKIRRILIWASSVAAVLIIGYAVWFAWDGNNQSTIATAYGQQKIISLSDQSEITLNAHSNIKYLKRWKNNQPREVWLKGEALFKVQHTNTDTNSIKPGERFIVYTDLAKIEVLGTVFNIRERRGKMEIVLQQGKIKVSFTRSSAPDIIMKPGQMLSINAETHKAITKTIIPEDYTAWSRRKLILTDASFQEIVEYMEDNFGKHIILSDPALAGRKVEGTFKIDNLDDALFVLSKALNVEIVVKKDTLFFTPK